MSWHKDAKRARVTVATLRFLGPFCPDIIPLSSLSHLPTNQTSRDRQTRKKHHQQHRHQTQTPHLSDITTITKMSTSVALPEAIEAAEKTTKVLEKKTKLPRDVLHPFLFYISYLALTTLGTQLLAPYIQKEPYALLSFPENRNAVWGWFTIITMKVLEPLGIWFSGLEGSSHIYLSQHLVLRLVWNRHVPYAHHHQPDQNKPKSTYKILY